MALGASALKVAGTKLILQGGSQYIAGLTQASDAQQKFNASLAQSVTATGGGGAITGLSKQAQYIQDTFANLKLKAPTLDDATWNAVSAKMGTFYATGAKDVQQFTDDWEASMMAVARDAQAGADEINSTLIPALNDLGAAYIKMGLGAATVITAAGMTASRIEELGVVLEVTRKNAQDLALTQAAAGKEGDLLAQKEHNLATAAQLSSENVAAEVKQVRELHLSGLVANEVVAEMIRYDLDWTRANELARLSQDAATYAMQDSSTTMQQLIQGIVTLQPRVLRTYGIMVNLSVAYEEWAKANGIAVEQMTVAERQQAALNAVLAQAPTIAGAYEAAMGTASKQIRSLKTDVVDLSEAYGQYWTPALDAGIGSVRGFMHWLTELDAPIRKTIADLAALSTAMLLFAGGALKATAAIQGLMLANGGLKGSFQAVKDTMLGLGGYGVLIGGAIALTTYLHNVKEANIEASASAAASAGTYADYRTAIDGTAASTYGLSEGLYKLVQAQDAATRSKLANELASTTDQLLKAGPAFDDYRASGEGAFRVGQNLVQGLPLLGKGAQSTAGYFYEMAKAGKASETNMTDQQLAVLADVTTVTQLANILGYAGDQQQDFVKTVITAATELRNQAEAAKNEAFLEGERYRILLDATDAQGVYTGAVDRSADSLRYAAMAEHYWGEEQRNRAALNKELAAAVENAAWQEIDAALKRNDALADLDVELAQKQRDLARDKARDLADIDAQLADVHAAVCDKILDLDRKLAEDREDAARDLDQKLADIDRDYADDQADARQKFQWDLEDASREHAEKREDIERDYYDDLADMQRDYNEKSAKLEEDREQAESDIRAKYKEARIQELIRLGGDEAQIRANWNDQMMQGPLADQMQGELDQLNQQYDEKQDDLAQELADERAERDRALQEQMADEDRRYAEERQQRLREYDRRLQELAQQHERERQEAQRDYQQKLDDLAFEYERQRAQIIADLEKQRQEIIAKYKEQEQDLATWYADRKDEIEREYQQQRDEIVRQLQLSNLKAQDEFGELPNFFQPTYDALKKQAEDEMGLWSDDILGAVQDVKDGLQAHSPSRVMMQLGRDIMAGLAQGLGSEDAGQLIQDALGQAAMGLNVQQSLGNRLAAVVPAQQMMLPASAATTSTAAGTVVNTPINVGAINNGLNQAMLTALVQQAVARGMRGY